MQSRRSTVRFEGVEFPTAHEAIQYAEASRRGEAIRLCGQNLVVSQQHADRLAAAGVAFAYLCDHHGRIMTIPVSG